jgi:non-ribosomal peptide synthetase-like protein
VVEDRADRALPETPDRVIPDAPSAALADVFAHVLGEVLGASRVSVDAHVFDDLGADSMVMARFCARVRKRGDLPAVSMRDVYLHPTVGALAASLLASHPDTAPAPARGAGPYGVESAFADVLGEVLGVERIPVEAHVFDELGADSMVMARFCARVRKRADLPTVAMKDVYLHPTIRRLARSVANPAPASAASSPLLTPSLPPSVPSPSDGIGATEGVPAAGGPVAYVVCAAVQLLVFLGYCLAVGVISADGYVWILAGRGLTDIYLRAVAFNGALFVGMCLLPIAAKWVLVGRWKSRQIRIWSLAYVRFWVVKTLIRSNPLALLFAGTPAYVLYLRALGAHIGRGVVIFSRTVPVCTDLLTIGDGSLVYKEAFLLCYRAYGGVIQTGSVTLGRDVLIGERCVLDIETTVEDDAQLGHASALYSGQVVGRGERWHGCPAEPTRLDYATVPAATCGARRRTGFCVLKLVQVVFLGLPLAEGAMAVLVTRVPALARLMGPDMDTVLSPQLAVDALVLSSVFFVGGLILGLLFVFTVPRALNRFLEPGRVYPLYGFHHVVLRLITRITNRRFFMYLFGDSALIVHYLRYLGYDLGRIVQTGSNFGMAVAHDNPHLSSIGSGTMVADGLSIMNAEFSSTSFRIGRVSIGADNFLGNHIAYPPGGRTGDNCLLATKVMIPLDGPVREGVGLLGSPCFEIPRSVERDNRFAHLRTPDELRHHLAAKNRYDLRTIGVFLFARWLNVFLLTSLGLAALDLYGVFAHLAVGGFLALSVLSNVAYGVLVERLFTAFRPLQPRSCSIYDPYFWWHERFWKVPPDTYLKIFDGTPFKNLIWRLLGVRVGRRVFDDGGYVTERTLAQLGDGCTLNPGSEVQCHSQEDGAFKCDRIVIGAGCTLGVGAMVHYGVTLGDGAVVAAHAFLMKGAEVPPYERWGGNPAARMEDDPYRPSAAGGVGVEVLDQLRTLDDEIRALVSESGRTMNGVPLDDVLLAQLVLSAYRRSWRQKLAEPPQKVR